MVPGLPETTWLCQGEVMVGDNCLKWLGGAWNSLAGMKVIL